jgi:hypothetical protein
MGDMGGQIDKMVSFIHFEAKNKKEEILAKAKQDKEAKKLEVVHREKLKIDADFNKRIKNVDTQNKMCAHCSALCAARGGWGKRSLRWAISPGRGVALALVIGACSVRARDDADGVPPGVGTPPLLDALGAWAARAESPV